MYKRILLLLTVFLSAMSVRASGYTVVFMGDSITELWRTYHNDVFFQPNDYLGKGISGQTTQQMIARFQRDALHYKPKAVVIMAGTNDLAQNQGYVPYERIVDNLLYMASLAREAGCQVLLMSIPPADAFWWHTSIRPAKMIRTVNTVLQERALQEGYIWVNLYPALVAAGGSIDPALSDDRIHPITPGYELIEQIVQPYLEECL